MTLGDWIVFVITWGTFAAGSYALGSLAWKRWGALVIRILSMLFVPRPVEITSSDCPSALSVPSVQRTDSEIAPVPPATFVPTRAQIIDSCRKMRGYGLSREQARDVVRSFDGALPNDLWTQVAPADDDDLVTPYAGRRTKARYYPEQPDLEYQEP